MELARKHLGEAELSEIAGYIESIRLKIVGEDVA